MSRRQIILALAAIYFAMANFTGAHFANSRCDWVDQGRACGPQSIFTGVVWPLYWPARFALQVTA